MFLRSPMLDGIPGLVHGFTTNRNHLGRPLDLGRGVEESTWAQIAENLGMTSRQVARMDQVHGATVLRADSGGEAGEGDALLCGRPGVLVAVRVADCVPVLVVGEGWVAAIHAGWRGLVAGVIPTALSAVPHGSIVAAVVGPCISSKNYEVGEEVVFELSQAGVPTEVYVDRTQGPKPHVDLGAAAAWQLQEAGCEAIDVIRRCTHDDPLLHSHRLEGAASGRCAGLVGWAP